MPDGRRFLEWRRATPAHPSAWCKANQGWATVTNVTSNGVRSIQDVKTGHEVFRLWKDGAPQEYFLVENRQKSGFDSQLPGQGLCIWHIDEAISSNSNEAHPKVALEQADGSDDLGVLPIVAMRAIPGLARPPGPRSTTARRRTPAHMPATTPVSPSPRYPRTA